MRGIVIGRPDGWPPFAALPETAGTPALAPAPGGLHPFTTVSGGLPSPVPPVDAHALLLDHLMRLWGLARHPTAVDGSGLGGSR